ncbi:MAG TPA: RNA polymerase subunit sigma-70 [Eubacteriaceae bacterium]|nr:RNA polymerase subunit sigma-70 [Eubacteriaceae bacterium]
MNNKDIEKHIADFVIENQQKYYRLAYSYVKNQHDALDVVQDSIIKAISSKDTLRQPEFIKTWFYRIVTNTALDYIRKQKRAVVSEEKTLVAYDTGETDQYPDIDLQKALDELPCDYRNIIILRYFEELKIEEVAKVLGENVNTVKTRLYKTLQKLRIQMSA